MTWIGAAFTLAGTFGLRRPIRAAWLFLCGNFVYVAWAIGAGEGGILTLNVLLAVLNLRIILGSWFGEEEKEDTTNGGDEEVD